MAFKRIVELTVYEPLRAGASTPTELISIADLHIEFDVSRSITLSENTASFVIYNAKEDTREKVLKEKNSLIFKMGYEDEDKNIPIGTIFMGNITRSVSERSGPDWITTVEATAVKSTTKSLDDAFITMSYAEDTLLSGPLQEIATALGVTVYGLDNAQIVMDNGFVFGGAIKAALSKCVKRLEANDLGLYIDKNEMVIYRTGDRTSRYSPLYLDYTSGLIRAYKIEEEDNQSKRKSKRIGFESLITPKLQLRGLVTIASEKVNGTFQIEKLTFSGDNFGGDNRCVAEAVV